MRFLNYSFICFLIIGCASDYKGLQRVAEGKDCSTLKPKLIETAWFNSKIDVMGKHLSGLLLVKQLDSATRMVFTNEAGVTFFDFSFDHNGKFRVVKIIKQLDKAAVINLLKNDFALMLGIPFRNAKIDNFSMGDEFFHGASQKNEKAYFITDKECASLHRLEWGSDRKRKVTIIFEGEISKPQAIHIKHHTFDMVMNLQLIDRNVTE